MGERPPVGSHPPYDKEPLRWGDPMVFNLELSTRYMVTWSKKADRPQAIKVQDRSMPTCISFTLQDWKPTGKSTDILHRTLITVPNNTDSPSRKHEVEVCMSWFAPESNMLGWHPCRMLPRSNGFGGDDGPQGDGDYNDNQIVFRKL